MKVLYIRSPIGEVQIQSDGKTVWVNHNTGCMIGRFSARGIDVHHLVKDEPELHCLDCRPGLLPLSPLPRREEWDSFKASMLKHHKVWVPEGLLEFLSPEDDLKRCAARAEEEIPAYELEEHARKERRK